MKRPTAIELLMGYKPNPDELKYTRLPDAMSDGSRLSSFGTRAEVYWSTINMPTSGFKALNQVLGTRSTSLGKQRALDRMDRDEGIMQSMYPADRFSARYATRKSSVTNIKPDVDYIEAIANSRKKNGGK